MGGCCASKIAPQVTDTRPPITTLETTADGQTVSAATPEGALFESGKRLFAAKEFQLALIDFQLCAGMVEGQRHSKTDEKHQHNHGGKHKHQPPEYNHLREYIRGCKLQIERAQQRAQLMGEAGSSHGEVSLNLSVGLQRQPSDKGSVSLSSPSAHWSSKLTDPAMQPGSSLPGFIHPS